MNLRHKYAVMTVRILLGLFLIFSGVSGFLVGVEATPEPLQPIMQVLLDTGLFYMIKVTETAAGIMFLVNFLPALAAIFIAPVSVGVIIFNAMVAPEMLPVGIILALFNAYFGYVYWDKYRTLFKK